MKQLKKIFRSMFVCLLLMWAASNTPTASHQIALAASSQIVISQVYGGGGNSGAPYRNDFIELFNRGTTSVSLSGMSLQYASATGTGNFNSSPITILSGTLAPGQYYLVQQSSGGGSGVSLPTPDAIGTVNIGATGGKVVLVNSTTGLACNGSSTACSAEQQALIQDLVGWGSANFFETSPAPATSNSTSISRNRNGCEETDNNNADFASGLVNPRNSAAPLYPCTLVDVTVGTGSPASCTEDAFNTALNSVQASGGGTITFNCGGPATITFTGGKIISAANVIIDGGSQITLSGVNTVRHFYVDTNATLSVKNITLSNGYDNSYGGGSILNLGTLNLDNTTIKDSNVDSGHSGGAIMSVGSLTINNSLIENIGGGSAGGLFIIGANADAVITGSTFSGNHTTSTQYGLGGAISNWNDADVTIHSSTLIQNQANRGGAIYNDAAVMTIDNGTLIDTNSALEGGGGIDNKGGSIYISNTDLTNNDAQGGGGIENWLGFVNIDNTTVKDNTAVSGAGISIVQGTVVLKNSVLNSNSATRTGGGIFIFDSNFTLSNSTISNNTANEEGGGIYMYSGNASLSYVTMSNNSSPAGGGIYQELATLTLKNVIINQGTTGANCYGAITSNGFNLSSDGSCGLNQGGDKNNVDPLLGPLADNGGPTLTHMLLSGSLAINAGQCISGVTTDQRGIPRLQGPACDIGAVERSAHDQDRYFVFLPLTIR